MTPQDFVAKWKASGKDERRDSQPHFNDLCRLLDVEDPATADPKHEWFTFEKGATKATGGRGWADVWREGCFGWEYKGQGKDLEKAYGQLLRYSGALENPPLLIVSDMERIRVHTNWTNTVQQVHELTLDDLLDAANRDLLRHCFTDPERLRPAKTRQALTEQAAEKFAALARRLRERGHDAEAVAHFVNRLVFCMFAEDVGLLPNKMFQRMIDAARADPPGFEAHARTLFGAMKSGGMVGFERVDWFNGGLFDDDAALPLEKPDLADLAEASRLDWSDIDPSILGTLFERGLDPDKRSQLGAHYTDHEKIMRIVGPVIVEPLTREWEAIKPKIEAALATEAEEREAARKIPDAAKSGARTRRANAARAEAEALHQGFTDRLARFRVLDPACGSGNFLNLSLLALKDLEHRANLEAEALLRTRPFPKVGPESVLGIELNPYAAELARVSVWIGEIQWMRRNGFDAARNPILRPLDTIECRDAVVNADGSPTEWPDADVVVGNPPFLGDKKMKSELGLKYAAALRVAYPDVSGRSDLCCYWFWRAWKLLEEGRILRAGLVATNSIRQKSNRGVLSEVLSGGCIFHAWSDEPWQLEGASVRVSLICFQKEFNNLPVLNGKAVDKIYAELEKEPISEARTLKENRGICFQGVKRVGGFEVDQEVARGWVALPSNPNGSKNCDVLRPWISGFDVVRRPQGKWIVDFGWNMPLEKACLYEVPFEHVERNVRPHRQDVRDRHAREQWWIFYWSRPELRRALRQVKRYFARPSVSKFSSFRPFHKEVLPDGALCVAVREDDTFFGIVLSRVHEVWALRLGSTLEDRPSYTPSTTFETFPFPEGLTPNLPAAAYADDPRAKAIAAAAADLNAKREAWLNPPDLVDRVPEVVPGYPDRIVPKDEAAAKTLKKRTLTKLYNARPAWLDHAHRALDEAVADAYGWGDDWRAGRLDDDEILARLFALNQDRAAAGR